MASGSKDGDIRIWDVVLGHTLLTLTGHSKAVTCVKWGGAGLVYTGSQDCTVKVWRADDVRLASYHMLIGSLVTTAWGFLKNHTEQTFMKFVIFTGIVCRHIQILVKINKGKGLFT
jgi:WD40 repeat protein